MNTTNVKAIVSSTKNLSAVWIIPIVALIAAGWMIYQYMSQQGPEIHLIVDTAEGVEPDKTLIKVRSVKVGVVTAVELSKDYGQIELTARMGSGTERMLRENSEFWMVKPRVGTQGITGLETLLSGPYIELEPGDANEESRNFVMLNDPPVAGSDVQGAHVVLVADKAGKLAVGDPVMFEGYVVGRVEQASFDVNKRQAIYQLFIFHPYSSLLRTRTRFWLNSGIDISFNAEGFNINFSSLQTLITGGATFGIPEGSPEGVELTSEMHEFQLYDNLQAVHAHMYEKVIPYVMLFSDSLRGLSPGAPVEYRGIRIGTVSRVPFVLNDMDFMADKYVPVLVDIELERIGHLVSSQQDTEQFEQSVANAFKNGLRASLKTGSLLSGSLFIDINYHPDEASKYENGSKAYFGYKVFPTVEGKFVLFQQQIENVFRKLEELPMDRTINQLNRVLAELDGMGEQVNELLSQKDIQQLPAVVSSTLIELQNVMKGFSPGSTNYAEIEQGIIHINEVMSQLTPLLDLLNSQPDALIFGAAPSADPVPEKGVVR